MTFDRNNALCYGQGFFSPNLVAIEQKNKTKQNKQTLLQGYHHFHWNRELHEFPKSSPPTPPPPLQYWRCTENMHFQNYFIAQHYHTNFLPSTNLPISYEKNPYPPISSPTSFSKQNNNKKKKNTSLSPYIWYLSIL